MKNRKYEQPKLELVAVAANDVLLASGGTEDPTVTAGGLTNTFTGARGELNWSDVWN